ncbi:hypothetical protein TNCV_4966991 [Trichonephila clavipes]|nr:hypothetical protein TNCV_4966991 [Trichonephila clavipes]
MNCTTLASSYGFREQSAYELNGRHRAARFAWTREHRDWSVEDWKRVTWSDESRFQLLNTGYGVRLIKPWILHARWELYMRMVAGS